MRTFDPFVVSIDVPCRYRSPRDISRKFIETLLKKIDDAVNVGKIGRSIIHNLTFKLPKPGLNCMLVKHNDKDVLIICNGSNVITGKWMGYFESIDLC